MNVSPLMHFAFEAAVSFILRFAYFLGLYFHIHITMKGERKESVEIKGLLEVNRWKNLLLPLVEPPAVFAGGVSCFLTSLFGKNVGEKLL